MTQHIPVTWRGAGHGTEPAATLWARHGPGTAANCNYPVWLHWISLANSDFKGLLRHLELAGTQKALKHYPHILSLGHAPEIAQGGK